MSERNEFTSMIAQRARAGAILLTGAIALAGCAPKAPPW